MPSTIAAVRPRLAAPLRSLALLLATLFLTALALAPSASAAPDITLDKQAPASVLFGDDSTVTLHATNPSGQPYGYNLSFRDVLPPGVSYVSTPATAVQPRIVEDEPSTGETTLIFENVSDLSPGSSYDLTYAVSHDTSVFEIGESYTNQAGAYINDDPRFVPDFDSDGEPAGQSTGSATDSATTQINAIEIVKDEPSPEGELLRGAHDHQTVYTLTVRNNSVNPTDSIRVEDWLPAGLEYLGCGTADNTTDAPTNPGFDEEYPASGLLNAPGNAPPTTDCVEPSLVETVNVDPDGTGPLPIGVYTHVVWNNLGNVPATGEIQVQYVAAIPLRENTTTWTDLVPPTAESLEQASNLDNNSGPETRDEQALTNYARATGSYDGSQPVSDDDHLTRTAEDLAVQKRVTPTTIAQGEISQWTFDISTSEYRYSEDVVVTDTLPDGLCPLGSANYEGNGQQEAECNPVGGQAPTIPYTDVTENADGSYDIVWEPTDGSPLEMREPSTVLTIEFPTRTRTTYQENFQDAGPILARDTWENTVEIEGQAFLRCAPNDPICATGTKIDGDAPDPLQVIDRSAARQEAGGVTIDKTVRERAPVSVDCTTGNYVDDPAPSYGPGDQICWQLRIDFATSLDSGTPELADFLPPGTTYVPGSAVPTGNNNVPSTFSAAGAADGVLTWDLGSDVDPGGLVFEWRFATTLGQSSTDNLGDIDGNLMKLSYANTEGQTFPLRDEVNFERSQARLDLEKGVWRVNGQPAPDGNDPNTDGAEVVADDAVQFRVDVTNDGDLDANDAVVWDELQDGITCAQVSSIGDSGTCSGTRISWSGLVVAAGASETLDYVVTMPSGVEPNRRFDNVAGVVSYQSATNTGTPYTYVPTGNIDPSAPPANAPAADDDSFVTTPELTFTKTRVTSVDEAGNDPATEATIGERIDYTATIVVPEGTTLHGTPTFTDVLGARQAFVDPPPAAATLDGNPVDPTDFILDTTSNTVSLQFPSPYPNPLGSGDDTIEIAFSATVADIADNRRTDPNQTLTNTAGFAWQDQDTTARSLDASVDTTIVEPNVAVGKDDDDDDDIVDPGQTVGYTVTASNQAETETDPDTGTETDTGSSVAHDLELVDNVPAGMTPVVGSISDGGVWDPVGRTITWQIASIAPGASVDRTYAVMVDDPAVVGQVFDNEVDLTATSLAGNVSGERTAGSATNAGYSADATDSVTLQGASLTKSVAPGSATIGNQVTYTAEVVFPADITFYDATVIDTLPDGMVFDEAVGVECAPDPCTPAPPADSLPAEPQPDGTTRVGWYLDDLPNQATARTYTITYTAHVADDYVDPAAPVVDGDTLTNSADAFSNGQDRITTPPTSIPTLPGGFEDSTGPDTADVEVIEPAVTIDKGVSGDADDDDARDTQPGDSYTYSLVVTNDGDAPAYDIDVTDTPDETLLRNITPVANPDATVTDGDGSDGTLGWTIPGPIAPNDSVTIAYTADLAPSADLSQGDTVVNVADVTSFWGVPESVGSADPDRYREYTDVPEDTVTLTVQLPDLAVVKTTGGGPSFPDSAVAQVGEPFPWRVVVSNDSAYADADSVDVSDVLPANWDYVPNSASFAPGGAAEPTIVADDAGDTLSWADVTDLGPGQQVVLTFQARPTVAAIADPGTGAGAPNVNAAEAAAVDASGATGAGDPLDPYEAEDDAQAILELPELSVTKTPDGDTVSAGDPASYSVVVANDGDVPARDVVVTDVLGVGQTYVLPYATANPATGFAETSRESDTPGTGQTTIEWTIDEIPANGSVTITVPIDTDPSLADATTLVNDASVISREITTPVTDGGSLVTDVDSDVGIVKTAQAAPVEAGEEMDFTLDVTNHGPSDATGVTVEDVLPANLTFVSADPDCSSSSGTVTCDVGDLAAGDSVSLTLRVLIDPSETVSVSNTATVDSTTPDTNQTNNESTATKSIGVEANVVVEKSAPTEPVLQGTTFDYTIRVRNAGVSTATDVTLSDPIPGAVSFESIDDGGADCSLDVSTDVVSCDLGTLGPGDEVLITVTVRAVDVGTPTNTVTADTPSTESTTTDNQDSADVTIVPAADLGVTKSAPATADAGGQIEYLLEVTNNGPSPATGVALSDTLPAGTELVSSADPACTAAASIVTCAVGDLAVSDSRSYSIVVSVPYALGDQVLTNSVVVTGNEGDLVPQNDSDQATTTVGPAADVSIEKTSNGATAGATASWTLVVRNGGPSTADPVTVADHLPAGTTFRSASPGQGSCGGGGGQLTCDLGAIAAGGSTQISVVADVPPGTAGQQLLNRATVSAPQQDPDPSNNVDEVTTQVSEPAASGPNLAMSKTASTKRPQLGERFSYTLVVTNTGDEDATGVRVVDTMSKSLDVQRVTTTDGRCTSEPGEVNCTLGTMTPGEQETIKLVVVPKGAGPVRNVASANIRGNPDGGVVTDIDPNNNDDDANVRVTAPRAGWALTKRASRKALRGGQTVRFKMTVRVGRRAVTAAQVCDRLPDGLVFVRAPGARFRDGRACWSVRYLGARARRSFTIVARAERGFQVRRIRNVAVAKAGNAARRQAGARVRIDPAFGGAGGGVTG